MTIAKTPQPVVRHVCRIVANVVELAARFFAPLGHLFDGDRASRIKVATTAVRASHRKFIGQRIEFLDRNSGYAFHADDNAALVHALFRTLSLKR